MPHLGFCLAEPRYGWVEQLRTGNETYFLLDTKPLPVLGVKRQNGRSEFLGNAAPGYCASRKLHYFGYKLTLLSRQDGLLIGYGLVLVNTDERVAVESVLEMVRGAARLSVTRGS